MFFWGLTTGTKFQDKLNLVVVELGKHYQGHARVAEKCTAQDKDFLKLYQKKMGHAGAFADFVHGL